MMENIFVMMLALGILCGIALLFHTLIHLNMEESMMMSAASVILLLFLGSLTGTFLNGMYGIYAMAAAGIVI